MHFVALPRVFCSPHSLLLISRMALDARSAGWQIKAVASGVARDGRVAREVLRSPSSVEALLNATAQLSLFRTLGSASEKFLRANFRQRRP
jgi:hypothetical protein